MKRWEEDQQHYTIMQRIYEKMKGGCGDCCMLCTGEKIWLEYILNRRATSYSLPNLCIKGNGLVSKHIVNVTKGSVTDAEYSTG